MDRGDAEELEEEHAEESSTEELQQLLAEQQTWQPRSSLKRRGSVNYQCSEVLLK